MWPQSPFVTTGCEGITHTGGLDDDTAIEVWLTQGGPAGYAKYQWRKVGGAAWANAFNGANLTSSTSSTALGASGVSVAFTSGAQFATDDHCLITSWAIENGANEGPLNTNRGTANAFPSSAVIAGTTGGIDIIDTTTTPNSVWMKIPFSSTAFDTLLPTAYSNVNNVRINKVKMLNGKLYVSIQDLTSLSAGTVVAWAMIDFTRDSAHNIMTHQASRSFGNTLATIRTIASRAVTGTNSWNVGGTQVNGVYARMTANNMFWGSHDIDVINQGGKQYAAVAVQGVMGVGVIDEYNGISSLVNFSGGLTDYMPAIALLPSAGSTTNVDLAYWNKTQNYVGVLTSVNTLTAHATGASSYTRQYTPGGTPGYTSGYPITSLAGTAGTSAVASSHNSLYIGQSNGVAVLQEALTSGGGSSALHVPNGSTRWPYGFANTLNHTGSTASAETSAYSTAYYNGGDYTMEAFVNTTYQPGGNSIALVLDAYDSGTAGGVQLLLSGATNTVAGICSYSGVQTCTYGTTIVNDGTWHHIAASQSGTTVRVYVDGVLERIATGVTTPAAVTNITKLCIGTNRTSPTVCTATSGRTFQGRLARVRFSNTARYTTNNIGVPSSMYTSDSNTVGQWALTDGSGATAADSGPNGLTLTRAGVNSTWAAFTAPTADYSYSSSLGNHVSAVAPSSDGNTLFIGINNSESGRGGVMRLYLPNSTGAEATHTFNASSSPALINERVTSLSCTNTDPDVYVSTMGGYTFLNFGPY
jgi:hypothetical protein